MLPTCRIENLARLTPSTTGFEPLCALLGIIIKLFRHIIQQQLNMCRSNVSQQLSVAAVAAVAAAATTAAAVLLHMFLLFCIWTMNTNPLRTYFHLLISGFCPGIHQSICVVYCLPCRKKKCVFFLHAFYIAKLNALNYLAAIGCFVSVRHGNKPSW